MVVFTKKTKKNKKTKNKHCVKDLQVLFEAEPLSDSRTSSPLSFFFFLPVLALLAHPRQKGGMLATPRVRAARRLTPRQPARDCEILHARQTRAITVYVQRGPRSGRVSVRVRHAYRILRRRQRRRRASERERESREGGESRAKDFGDASSHATTRRGRRSPSGRDVGGDFASRRRPDGPQPDDARCSEAESGAFTSLKQTPVS